MEKLWQLMPVLPQKSPQKQEQCEQSAQGFSVLTAAQLLGKCQRSKARILKLIKFLHPNPHLFNNFNLLLILSTIPLVVLCSKYPTISASSTFMTQIDLL